MRTMKRAAAMLFALALVLGSAGAETMSLNGTVEAGVTVPVYAPIGGTVDNVALEQGMHVNAGDVLFTYKTEKTYASEDGTVTGVFVQAGDDAETVANRYGADLYIEGTILYTVSSSVSKAYTSAETTVVHTGETVYLVCRTDSTRKGTGIITGVEGSNYSVLVSEGNFVIGDSAARGPRQCGTGQPGSGNRLRRCSQRSREGRGPGGTRRPAAGNPERNL